MDVMGYRRTFCLPRIICVARHFLTAVVYWTNDSPAGKWKNRVALHGTLQHHTMEDQDPVFASRSRSPGGKRALAPQTSQWESNIPLFSSGQCLHVHAAGTEL